MSIAALSLPVSWSKGGGAHREDGVAILQQLLPVVRHNATLERETRVTIGSSHVVSSHRLAVSGALPAPFLQRYMGD